MKLGFASVLASLAALSVTAQDQTPPPCQTSWVRKEIRNMTPNEWAIFNGVQNSMHRDGWYDWYSQIHNTLAGLIHSNSLFFPFHRQFILDFESTMKRYDPKAFLPYWNSMVDFQRPDKSPVLSSQFLGSNGVAGSQCVKDGLPQNWNRKYPRSGCMQRKYNGPGGNSINPLYSPEAISYFMQISSTYKDLRNNIENSIHGAVHLGISADMATMNAPNDPVFWLHHANIDRIWSNWQSSDLTKRQYMYDGTNAYGQPVYLTDTLPNYPNVKVNQVMAVGRGSMCYSYDDKPAQGSLSRRDLAQTVSSLVTLPQNILDKFFPAVTNGTYNEFLDETVTNLLPTTVPNVMQANGVYSLNLTDVTKPLLKALGSDKPAGGKDCDCNSKVQMPKPAPLTTAWLKMNKISPCKAGKVHKLASDFTDELNRSDYISKFVLRY
ncbi:hypothetical protein H4219_002897 [Mycoemilia scoparia]|uniref:Tyrosinase copper-binding domain-containing protein n=1 Tax=Mycoemilia scoparia TaxID=417184 RepID=A0A9W7ZWB9_9FUNG|nr:hypothetical protein H4219_002897 [Mycoemilia scoparia]